jgi:hypothetical protein
MTNLLIEVREKGWCTDFIPDKVASAYGQIKSRPSSFRSKMKTESYVCERMLLSVRDPDTAGEHINALARHIGHPVRHLSNEECIGILSNLAVELFADSNPQN